MFEHPSVILGVTVLACVFTLSPPGGSEGTSVVDNS